MTPLIPFSVEHQELKRSANFISAAELRCRIQVLNVVMAGGFSWRPQSRRRLQIYS